MSILALIRQLQSLFDWAISFRVIIYLIQSPNATIPGIQHKQFVTIAALTESNSGRTRNISNATPIVCNDSIMKMKRKCDRCGRFHDLKKQIRRARMNAPISGMENAISNAHIHATRSSSGITDTNDLSRSCLREEMKWNWMKQKERNSFRATPTFMEMYLPNLCCSTVIYDFDAIVRS